MLENTAMAGMMNLVTPNVGSLIINQVEQEIKELVAKNLFKFFCSIRAEKIYKEIDDFLTNYYREDQEYLENLEKECSEIAKELLGIK